MLPVVTGRSNLSGLRVRSLGGVFNLNTPRFGLVHGADGSERRAIIAELWKAIKSLDTWDLFEARLVMKGGWLEAILDEAVADGHLVGVWEMEAAPYLEVSDLPDFFATKRKHFGKELDRRQRRIKEQGEVEYVITREYSSGLIDRYLELETRGWKGRGGTAAVQDDRAAMLHHRFAEAIGRKGKLMAYELRLNGQAIAMSLNVIGSDEIFHWKTTYDEKFSRLAPGNLLFRRMLENARAEGIRSIDFLSPSTPNKLKWATGERAHAAFYVFRKGFLGRLCFVWKFLLIANLRKFKRYSSGPDNRT